MSTNLFKEHRVYLEVKVIYFNGGNSLFYTPLYLPITTQQCPLHFYIPFQRQWIERSKIIKRVKKDSLSEWVLKSSAFLCIEINIECNSYWI